MTNRPDTHALLSGRLLAKNTLFALIANGAPIIVALFTIPLLISGLGLERFGILTLVWVVIGYFGIFDLGIGRAITLMVARKLGAHEYEAIPALVWTGLALLLILGLAGMVAGILFSPIFVEHLMKLPPALQEDTITSFIILSISIPFVISAAGIRGILEAYQRFDQISLIRIPLGIFIFVGPLLTLPFSEDLSRIVAVLLVGRILAWAAYLGIAFNNIPGIWERISFKPDEVRKIFSFGLWVALANVIGSILIYLDRFFISGLMGTAALAYYAPPHEMATRVLVIPMAMVSVMFPAFASSLKADRGRVIALFDRSIHYGFLVMFPLSFILVTFASEILGFWLGNEFAAQSSVVLQWLAFGILMSSINRFPAALIQGAGHPDLITKSHLIQLFFYVPLLWWLLRLFGIAGAALAWSLRVLVDTIILFWLSGRIVKEVLPKVKTSALKLGVATITMMIGLQITDISAKIGFALFVLLVIAFIILRTVRQILGGRAGSAEH